MRKGGQDVENLGHYYYYKLSSHWQLFPDRSEEESQRKYRLQHHMLLILEEVKQKDAITFAYRNRSNEDQKADGIGGEDCALISKKHGRG